MAGDQRPCGSSLTETVCSRRDDERLLSNHALLQVGPGRRRPLTRTELNHAHFPSRRVECARFRTSMAKNPADPRGIIRLLASFS